MATLELKVPDLGGFGDVPVIEVLVAPGQTVAKDDPLVTLESEKATMEVPADAAGTVRDVRVKIGDKVSQGTVLVTVDAAGANEPSEAAQTHAHAAATAAVVPPTPASSTESSELDASDSDPLTPATATVTEGGATELVVPDLGDFHDIPVIEVLVKPGDTVAKDDPLITLESEKATMEVPASTGGVVRDVRVQLGERVSKGTVIATLAGAAAAPASSPSAPAPAPAPTAQPVATNGHRNGTATTEAPSSYGAPGGLVSPPATNGHAATPATSGPVHASPAIRRFARELGVDLARVTPSGPNGRITRDDVQGFVKGALASPSASAPVVHGGNGLQLIPWPKIDFAKFGPIERKPLTRIQKLSGPNLARNWAMIPHVTQNEDADVTDLEAFRKQLNSEQSDAKVTMLAFLLKASVAALKKYPTFNSSLDGEELVLKQYYHLGFAADTPNGLVVPVIRDVDRKGIVEIARETGELAKKARDGKLGPAEMTGSTFTISSLGGIGGTSFTPIINAPEVAILGATRTAVRPVWDGSAFVPRTILPLSLSYDHRVIDGALAARFAAYLATVLGDLRRVLL